MTKQQAMVKEFMEAFDQKIYDNLNQVPDKVMKLREALIAEEHKEFEDATELVDKLDALCDILYVVLGTAVAINARVLPLPIEEDRLKFSSINVLLDNLRARIPCIRRLSTCLSTTVKECHEIAKTLKLDLNKAFEAVHKNNMGKLWKSRPSDKELIVIPKGDRFLVKNKEGKVVKPMGHRPPKLEEFVCAS